VELNDMLSKLFEQKCKELQDEIFHLIEERLHMQNVILKESKDSLDLLIDLEDNAKGDSDADNSSGTHSWKLRSASKRRSRRRLQSWRCRQR
jgi:hypothetical protein